MNVAFVRGAYLNGFEGQNYDFTGNNTVDFTGYSSRSPLDVHVPFPVVRLPSLADLGKNAHIGRLLKVVANRTVGDVQVLFGLERCIDGYDIVHTADPHYYFSYQAAKLRQKNRIRKLIVTSWETIPHNNESTMAKKKLKQFVMKQADAFLCYTQRAKQCLVKEGVHEDKITVIPLGVNTTQFSPKHTSIKKPLSILYVGRMVSEKGVEVLYEAFRRLVTHPQYSHAILRFVGTGPLKKRIAKHIQKDSLHSNVNIESVTYNEMGGVYRDADILVIPSMNHPTWEEQLGMVSLEGLASGLPIIAFPTGALPEVLGECGQFPKRNTVNALYDELLTLCGDATLRTKLGTMGRERAESRYCARTSARKLLRFYQSVMSPA